MKRGLSVLFVLNLLNAIALFAAQPPYKLKDPAADINDIEIFRMLSSHAHDGNGSNPVLNVSTFTVKYNTYLGAVSGRVGIGTTTPAYPVDVVGSVHVSSATTSSLNIGFCGAYQTLPTNSATGCAEGSLAYQNSDNTLYVATETVTSAGSWRAAW